jgi:hypothetical protein
MDISVVAIGRTMKGSEKFIALLRGVPEIAGHGSETRLAGAPPRQVRTRSMAR